MQLTDYAHFLYKYYNNDYSKYACRVIYASALIDYNPIVPDQISTFTVMTTDNPEISRYRVSFKDLLGGMIEHIE